MSEKTPIILDKDYLNRTEAAIYMGCSEKSFRLMEKRFNIPSGKIPGGRIVYRRNDLFKLSEQYFTAPTINLESFEV